MPEITLLLATDAMHCTDQKTIHIEVSDNPVAAFHGMDTLRFIPAISWMPGQAFLPIYGAPAIPRKAL